MSESPASINREGMDFASCQKLPVNQYGGDPINFSDFMSDYYMYATAYGWSQATMAQRLPLYLKGAAREAWQQINKTEANTWTKIKDALAAKLVGEDIKRIMRQKFYSRVQNPDESVSEFAYHLSTLADKAFETKPGQVDLEKQIKELLQDQFLAGVNHEIKTCEESNES